MHVTKALRGPSRPRGKSASQALRRVPGDQGLGGLELRSRQPHRATTASLFPRLFLGWINADFSRPNTHFSAFFEMYKIHTPSHRFDTQNLQIFAIFGKIRLIFQIFANVAEIAAKNVIFR